MALVLMPLTSNGQDVFAKYDGNPDVTYVNIKPKMFQILAKVELNTDNTEEQDYVDMVKSITSLKAIVTGKQSISADIANWVNTKSKDLDELMEVRDDGTVVKFYTKDGKKENHVEELLIYVNGLSERMKNKDVQVNEKERQVETVVVSLTGNIDLKKINFDFISNQVQLKESSASMISEEGMIFKDLKVYPNPSQDRVTIDLPTELDNDVNITVLDYQGKQMLSQLINSENNTLNVSNLQAGVYLIEITHEDSRIVKRFVKK